MLDEVMNGNIFKHALDEKNYVKCREGEIKIENLITKDSELYQEGGRQDLIRTKVADD